MGCDIHLYTELKKNIGDKKDKWVNVDNWRYNPFYVKDDDGERELVCQHLYNSRNYTLFTILAGVRDYEGTNKPIVEPRGLPKDVSEITKNEADRWDGDGHTHSFLTLQEISEYFKTQPKIKYSGLISQKEADELEKSGKTPEMWCQGASPQLNLVYREWEDTDLSLKPLINSLEERYKDEMWMRDSEKLTKKDMENIRIVFWFDN